MTGDQNLYLPVANRGAIAYRVSMSASYRPCASCARHVLASSSECPFCNCTLTPVDLPAPAPGGLRLSRSAAVAIGAALLASGIAVDGCGWEARPVYGGPPPDWATDAGDAGDASDAPSDNAAPPADR